MTVALSPPPLTAQPPPVRLDDPARLAAVASVGLLDEPVTPGLGRLVSHAARLLGVPTAVVSLVDARRQFIAAACGLTARVGETRELSLTHSLCAYGVRADAPLVIDDARRDERWVAHPAVVELGIVAYCAVPLRTASGHTIGTLCAADAGPRLWSAADVALLDDLAATVMAELELRAANKVLAAREAALAASEREMRLVFAAMRDVVLVLDADGTYRRVVPTAPDLLYRPAEDVVGRRMHDVLPRASADRFLLAICLALQTGGVVEISYTLPVPVGERHFEATISPLDAETVLWVARDVTTRAEAEAARRASEERLALIYASASDLMFLMAVERADGAVTGYRCESVNASYLAVTGLPEAAVVGRRLEEILPGEAAVHARARYDQALASGEVQRYDERVELPTGRRVFETTLTPVLDAAGTCTHLLGAARDVTERRTAEAAARRLTAIIEATPDLVALATPSGRIDYLNGAGRKLLGVAGGADAVPAAQLTVGRLQPQFAPGGAEYGAVAEALTNGSWSGETVFVRCDGRTIPVEQVLLAHRGADGAVEYLSATLRDITKRKQSEAALRGLALVDELTQLYNRRGFLAFAERARDVATAAGQGGALFYIDLDEFKPVNDRYGHAEGDRALAAVAGVLRRTFRDSDVVARLGGDEFVAFAPCGSATVEGAWATVERVCARLDAQVAAENATGARPYAIRFSIGVAVLDPARPEPITELMAAADAQLYLRKQRRRTTE